MKPKHVKLAMRDGLKCFRIARWYKKGISVVNNYHRTRWQVVHVKTGRSIMRSKFYEYDECLAFGEFLVGLFNWEKIKKPDDVSKIIPKSILKKIKAYTRKHGG